ncbi:Gfo/Idh/MocA family protein [Effusibacillus lacus]|uniref:Gfo/Idh/MocA family protein n=1 Tax=Effusibacillus lacus TaxID=1348429 RepID=UPI000BB88119|nr:Gfo/Idh/MocA family oxidoreductase [Effusibacillus lacus]TCS73523.1 putative dehydrogenase [Effusibacillus lacus]
MTLKIGVIGTGVMGKNYIRVLSGLQDRCRLTGVFDIDCKKAAGIAGDYEIQAFSNLAGLLQSVDAAIVAVPVFDHYQVAKQCLENGIHILVEKPITATVEQGERLRELARDKNRKLQVGHIELFNPTIRVLKNIMQQEEVIAVDIHRLSPFEERVKNIDVIMDTMIHDLYILSYLSGLVPVSFTAYGSRLHEQLDHVVATFQFANGMLATLTASLVTEEKVRTIHAVTKKAYIRADLLDKKILISRSTNFFLSNRDADYKQQNIVEKVIVPAYEPLREQLLHFIDCIENDKTPIVSAKEGLDTLRMAEAVKQSIIKYAGKGSEQ